VLPLPALTTFFTVMGNYAAVERLPMRSSDDIFPDVNLSHGNLVFVCVCLTPLSTIFQLYRGGQFYWWGQPENLEKTHQPVVCY
jgi:hypothetical protein